MASSFIEEVTCPKCHTKVRVKVTNGVYPMRTEEIANYPVCREELFHKNITGDIEESFLSLDETIEPYLLEYKNKQKKTAVSALSLKRFTSVGKDKFKSNKTSKNQGEGLASRMTDARPLVAHSAGHENLSLAILII